MAAKKQARENRRRALRILLEEKKDLRMDQKELVGMLEAMQIPATQASVSRDLREIGAVWVDGHYEIPEEPEEFEDSLERALPFILKAKPVPTCHILIDTRPGAGPVVSQAIKDRLGENIVGTVAGHDSVLVLTPGDFFQKLMFDHLIDYFEPTEEEEEPPAANGEPAPAQEKD